MLRKALVAAVAGLSLVACQDLTPRPPDTALGGLNQLVTRPAATSGYSRASYPHWVDEDRDGCDTRSEVLERAAISGTEHRNARGCVDGARILDGYSGREITEEPGSGSAIDIDHVVALGNVHASSNGSLSSEQRRRIANDFLNLLPVDRSLNRAKGASSADEWLPPNLSYRCEYVARQVSVKVKYRLSVTQAERNSISQVLNTCPDQPLVI
jgi:hypothetical protein